MDTLLTCIIIDDEPLAVRLLESFVTKTSGLKLLGSYTDSVEAINAVREQRPQLLFLDIQMPDLNGMELAHMLPEGTKVIFTTAFKEYAYESYEVRSHESQLKHNRYNKVITAVEKVREWFGRSQEPHAEEPAAIGNQDIAKPINTVFLKVDGEYRQVALDKILYVCGMKDYVMFYVEGERKPLITHLTMKSVEEMLPTNQFLRVHRSYIVALDKIRSVDRNDCIYIGDEIIRVTDAFKETFNQFLQSRFPGN